MYNNIQNVSIINIYTCILYAYIYIYMYIHANVYMAIV